MDASHIHLVTTATIINKTDCTQEARPKCSCAVCKEERELLYCNYYKAMPVDERIKVANKNKLCLNCLKPGHTCQR